MLTRYDLEMRRRKEHWIEDFDTIVGGGMTDAWSFLGASGDNHDIDTGTVPEDLWEFGGLYTFPEDGTAPIDTISSSSASDTDYMVITGLDINGDIVVQPALLNGQSKVTLNTPLWRFFNAYNGSSTQTGGPTNLVGNIYIYEDTPISGGIPIDATKVRGYVTIECQQSHQFLLTVPRNYCWHFKSLNINSASKISATIEYCFFIRLFGGVQRSLGTNDIESDTVDIHYNGLQCFPPLTDFWIRVGYTSANNSGLQAGANGWLQKLNVDNGRQR